MTTIPSTPTFSSRNLEAKTLADGNAVLIQKKEVLEREVRDLTTSRDAMIRSIWTGPAQAEAEKKAHLDSLGELERQIERRKIELRRIDTAIDEGNTALKDQKGHKRSLEAIIEVLNADVTEWEGKKATAEAQGRAAETKYAILIKAKGDEIANLMIKATQIKHDNEIMENRMKNRLAKVADEEARIITRWSDLEIYEARLKRDYPNNTITP